MAKKPTPHVDEADRPVVLKNDNGRHFCKRGHIIKLQGDACSTTFHYKDPVEPGKIRTVTLGRNLGYYHEEYIGELFILANQSVIFNRTYVIAYSVGAKITLAGIEEKIQVSRRCRPGVDAKLCA